MAQHYTKLLILFALPLFAACSPGGPRECGGPHHPPPPPPPPPCACEHPRPGPGGPPVFGPAGRIEPLNASPETPESPREAPPPEPVPSKDGKPKN
jgi:hypothetical protein